VQLSFRVADNASVKSYVMIQVKKSNETEWHILRDSNDHLWKFREVDLTNLSGTIQEDFFNIQWAGRHDAGHYPVGTYNFDIKFSVIDQGANYVQYQTTFTGNIIPIAVNITGPSFLNSGQTGQFTAETVGGSGVYTNYRWWWRNDESQGGGGGDYEESIRPNNGDIGIDYAPPATWFELTQFEGQTSISLAKPADFSVKCEVTDSEGSTASDIHSVTILCGSAKMADGAVDQPSAPDTYLLQSNYPNPFNPNTTITFGLPEDAEISLVIYSVTGQKIAELAGGFYKKGYHQVKWAGQNLSGQSVANGLYIYELQAGSQRLVKKMVLAR
jgi:flagellar hook assembly protein FlgD